MTSTLDVDGRTFFSAPKLPPFTIDPSPLPEFVRAYESEELNASYKLAIDHGNLVLSNNWNPTVTLYPIAKDEFNGGHFGIFVFNRDDGQHVSGLSVFTLAARNVSFKKTE